MAFHKSLEDVRPRLKTPQPNEDLALACTRFFGGASNLRYGCVEKICIVLARNAQSGCSSAYVDWTRPSGVHGILHAKVSTTNKERIYSWHCRDLPRD
jgi:hypothetical protein